MPFYGYFPLEIIKIVFCITSFLHRVEKYFRERAYPLFRLSQSVLVGRRYSYHSTETKGVWEEIPFV